MDVGIVTPQYPPNTRGGGEISVQLLAEQLSIRTEHNVQVHSFDGHTKEQVNGIPVVRHRTTPPVPEVASAVALYELSEVATDVDVLHGYNMELHPALGLLSKFWSIPTVAHLNSYTYIDKRTLGMELSGGERLYNDVLRRITRRPVRSLLSEIDQIIALSTAIERVYADYLGTAERVTRVTNMIDPSVTPDRVDYELSTPPRVLYVGNLTAHKGVEYLLRAVAYLNQPVELRVVGNGEELETLEQLVRSYNLQSVVDFTGKVPYDEIPRHYRWADIFVHPGIWPEPLNRTLLEAMQHGLAVVVTNRGGPPEAVQADELIVEPGNPRAVADGIEFAIENRASMGEIHRTYVAETHHPERIVPQIDTVYQKVTCL